MIKENKTNIKEYKTEHNSFQNQWISFLLLEMPLT